ncbi:hypothetical protein TNCV_696871 [Trichonephila clavipes]|nr:hypothetical protein TNCV_696871 [Trichonephila clavipes]
MPLLEVLVLIGENSCNRFSQSSLDPNFLSPRKEYVALKLHAVVICVTVLVMPNVTVSQHVLKYAVQQQEEMDVA